MSNRLIWRIEDNLHRGPYEAAMPGIPKHFWDTEKRHPGPWSDSHIDTGKALSVFRESQHIFGFRSITAARTWFNKPKVIADWMTMYLVAFRESECDKVFHGSRQTIFLRADRRAVIAITDLHARSAYELTQDALAQLPLDVQRLAA